VKLLIATGLSLEAKVMAGPGVTVIAGGGDGPRLEQELESSAIDARLILSSGLAGALDPGLRVGDIVLDGPSTLVEQLRMALPEARVGPVLGSDFPIGSVAAKAEAWRSGMVAVDMESHIARRVAARHGLPCLVARVISDRADRAVPAAALAGMKRDGGIAVGAVLASIALSPRQLPSLIGTARDAQLALRALGRLHDVLRGGGIGGLDLRELALDV
jgi:adenosylhomocysteine nucleosidase